MPAAYAALRDTMRRVLPAIQDSNVVVEYRASGLGFAGDPNGPDVAPIITVRLQNMTFTPVTLELFGASVNLPDFRSAEHTSELQSLMRISYAVLCLKKTRKTEKIAQ